MSTIMWTAQHERVYVPLTEWIPPEPFFAQLPEREIVTTDGARYTQVSHALISRQMSEHAALHGWDEKTVRLVSLEPVNPVNTPNDWERGALQALQAGEAHVFTVEDHDDVPLMKYITPLRAQTECLQCHVAHSPGSLIGALSISEPAASRRELVQPQIITMIATHAGIFVVIALTIILLLSYIRRQWFNLGQINDDLQQSLVKLADSESKQKEMAVTDELTGLKNRRGFFFLAEQQMKEANRKKTKTLFIFIDLDGMKSVNDTYGHAEGDQALIATANILKHTFREPDVIARLGGDEFVVLITNTEEFSGNAIIDRLQVNLNYHNAIAKSQYRLSLSAGVIDYDSATTPPSIEELLKKADDAMYEIKRAKKTHNRNNGTVLPESARGCAT